MLHSVLVQNLVDNITILIRVLCPCLLYTSGIGLISGVGAKELVVSTLGVLYTNEGDVENVNLSDLSLIHI